MLNYLLAVLAIGISFVLTVALSGALIISYFDLLCVIITVIFPFLYQWALFGSSGVRNAFMAGSKKAMSMEDIKLAQLFFKSYAKTVWFSALLFVVTVNIAMLIYLEDRSGLGPNIHRMLLALLYAIIMQVAVIAPFLVLLKKRSIELIEL
ncbi:MAG: hypothetical protein LBK63_12430 [Treponema sp.]|jgi:hypothetical protein|nr:hypothetical protein [Treponema sp.]